MNRLEYFLELLKKNPNNPMVHYSLALEYFKAKDYVKSIEHMETYLGMHEDEGAGYKVLAKCYEELGEYEKAIKTLQEGIEKSIKHNHPSMAEEMRTWLEDLK
ncbi:MAG: tetratricopeptide repeat protein, partial [Hydrogenobacter sp.]